MIYLAIFVFGCKDNSHIDYIYTGTYVYCNQSDFTIQMNVIKSKQLLKSFTIPKNDSLSIVVKGNVVSPFFFEDIGKADSVVFDFEHLRYLSYTLLEQDGLFYEKNYDNYGQIDSIKETRFSLRKVFSSKDFDIALHY